MNKRKTILATTVILTLSLLAACVSNEGMSGLPEEPEIPPAQEQTELPPEEPRQVVHPNFDHININTPGNDSDDDRDSGQTQDTGADPVKERIAEIIESMTLRDKICQMLIVTPDSITGISGTTIAGDVTEAALENYPVGGIIQFSPNIVSSEQILLFNTALQRYSEIPLLIAVDEEGGRVARLQSSIGAHSVRAMLTYEDDGEETAYENAVILSDALRRHGFNTNFAPVADVWSNRSNTVIGNRAYSTDFDIAAVLVAAAVRGFNDSNIACSLKHFPGHGNTREDSHHRTAYVNKTLDELREDELKPFISGIAAGTDMVMTGHLIVPGADELPATLSKVLITDVLRDELGFDGVVITDSLAMNAISRHFSASEVAVKAVDAGVDIILMPVNIDETISALIAAVESGEIPESRIDESVSRILKVKISIGIIEL